MMLGLPLLIALALAVGVLALFIGLGRIIESRDSSFKDRLDILAVLPVLEDGAAEAGQSGRRSPLVVRLLSRLIPGQASGAAIATELARANLPLTVQEYLAVSLACVGILFLLTLVLSRQLVFACVAGAFGSRLPGLYVQRKQEERQLAFQEQLPDVLTLLVGTLRSGYGITSALDTVAKQMPRPASEEFGRVVREIGLGIANAQALQNLVRRVRSDDLDLMVTAMTIQYEVGGNLAMILETIGATIRDRIRLKGEVRTLTVQQRLTRVILTGLPFFLAVVMYMINPEYIGALFTPGPTLLIPIGSLVFLGLGWVVMGKMADIQF